MAARLGLLFLLLVVAVWISQAGPVPGQSVNPRVGNVLQNSGQTKSSVNPQTADLSGTYIGVLDYPKAGSSRRHYRATSTRSPLGIMRR
jgi:hypothetical protein